MGSSQLSLKRALLASTFLSLSLMSSVAMAQNNQDPQSAASTDNTPTAGTSTKAGTTTSKSTSTPTSPSTSSTSTAKVTMPGLSSTTPGTTNTALNTGMPTLSKTANLAVPTYPAPSVPPTNDAPFMNRSTLPDGTVFIAVGAILGTFGLAILVWRGIVACLLHRSVERATAAQHAANDKAAFPAPPPPFYKYTDRDSSPSLAVGSTSGRGQRRTTRGPIPSATPSQTNLFFSPTAPGGMAAGANRDSRYLPSGFYASASPVPPHGHGPSISLSNLRPSSRGHTTGMGPSPPDSPGARATPVSRNFSTSSINLNRPPSGRAPSAYLDDLLDEQGGQFPPGQFPPPNPHHHHHHPTHSQSSLGRFS
ncbi:hypothetical protein GQ53DRAFT_749865 [Thozetella sp. PMI_491]|nr:hypothetical protein GQ53DRAFT_749865 [Thozetella sp. PMI_491]